jgi:hypothetical protein
MSEKKKAYTLGGDEKATPVMVYTMVNMTWGEVVTKGQVRVSTYLRTLNPDYVSLYEARSMPVGATVNQALAFTEIHIRTPQVIGFHLLPNAPSEPLDYDPSEANRKMEPVSVLVGPFRFDASMRISNMLTLAKYVEIFSDVYISLYDAAVTCPLMPGLGVVRAPLALIRRDAASFAPRA